MSEHLLHLPKRYTRLRHAGYHAGKHGGTLRAWLGTLVVLVVVCGLWQGSVHADSHEPAGELEPRDISALEKRYSEEFRGGTVVIQRNVEQELLRLLERDRNLIAFERVQNQEQILQLLAPLDTFSLLLLRENPDYPTLRGWVALSETLRLRSKTARAAGVRNWLASYPEHPVEWQILQQYVSGNLFSQTRKIALLLPLSSQFEDAARIFAEGFNDAHRDDLLGVPTTIAAYDVGDSERRVVRVYRHMLREGVDFVVGPLGQRAVDMLFNKQKKYIPTLVIGRIPEAKIAENLYGISLSPEQEARQVALRAFSDGHRRAVVVRFNSATGQRLNAAFIQQWQELGGEIVEEFEFFPTDLVSPAESTGVRTAAHTDAVSIALKDFLQLEASDLRGRALRERLGVPLKFTSRRRDDVDFLFLVATPTEARSFVPKLRFLQAHDLPVYATSHIYSGTPNPSLDADLDGVMFAEMDWLVAAAASQSDADTDADADTGETTAAIDSAQLAPTPPDAELATPKFYYRNESDRLYALGWASFLALSELSGLRADSAKRFDNPIVGLGVQPDGNVWRYLTPVRFAEGMLEQIPRKEAAKIPSPPPTPLSAE